VPDLVQKQLIAVIDSRTTMVCLRAAGQTRKVDEPFDVLTGSFMEPPFHYGCRTTVAPWVPGMISDQKKLANAEIMRRPRSERRFGPEGYEGRLPAVPPKGPLTVSPRSRLGARWDNSEAGEEGFMRLFHEQEDFLLDSGDDVRREMMNPLTEWKQGDYRTLNGTLFDPDLDPYDVAIDYGIYYRTVGEWADAMDEAFTYVNPISFDLRVIRSTDSGFDSVRALLNGKPGDAFEMPGYLATTGGRPGHIQTPGIGGDVDMEIFLPRGTYALSYDAPFVSGVNAEWEVLLPRNGRLILAEEPQQVDGRWIVRVIFDDGTWDG
jgi:hypothetical protein